MAANLFRLHLGWVSISKDWFYNLRKDQSMPYPPLDRSVSLVCSFPTENKPQGLGDWGIAGAALAGTPWAVSARVRLKAAVSRLPCFWMLPVRLSALPDVKHHRRVNASSAVEQYSTEHRSKWVGNVGRLLQTKSAPRGMDSHLYQQQSSSHPENLIFMCWRNSSCLIPAPGQLPKPSGVRCWGCHQWHVASREHLGWVQHRQHCCATPMLLVLAGEGRRDVAAAAPAHISPLSLHIAGQKGIVTDRLGARWQLWP